MTLWVPFVCACGRMKTNVHGGEQFYDVLRERHPTWECPACDEIRRAMWALADTMVERDEEDDD